jgi:hypothetical protein
MRVVAAAINRNNSGEIVSLPAPARHHDIIRHIHETYGDYPVRGTQGFVLNDGTFVMRKPALHIAEKAGQLLKSPVSPAHGLFSEDVW